MSLLYFHNVRGQRTRCGIANESWMASQLLLMVSEVLPSFASKEKACASEDKDMPDEFVARILDCDVKIKDVASSPQRHQTTSQGVRQIPSNEPKRHPKAFSKASLSAERRCIKHVNPFDVR